ncbi:MAG: tRNA 5-methoxyuridine(34)/uridine 5-oxyacetic acid(34) synthase CmoB [Thiothrix sp.]|nr:tRNA 5-methoxyuridine(34)/uridine 5-oxyacetic acid(34) synthase CmoB [Thiothrix sp.]HPE61154.1 tRNA 5-methoxyuridine(34)/uridine 5-oxyacetic acid(34) synthase CmoB [Thiolinea sp.]
METQTRHLLEQRFATLYADLARTRLADWCASLPPQLAQVCFNTPHGKRELWLETLLALPEIQPSCCDFNAARVVLGRAEDCDAATRQRLQQLLEVFIPWRKGPFELFGIVIDTEWRSDWKWARLAPYLEPLSGRLVLDVGCGSGYHLWRMLGAGAQQVIGVDPSLFFMMQFHAVKTYAPDACAHFLPLRSEDLPDFGGTGFDTVFSMGVLYHRRSPLYHLQELHAALRQGGQLVLETLVVDGDVQTLLMPAGRYGKMRNVWFIPSVPMLLLWLRRLGFVEVRCVDVTRTSVAEQRATAWMRFESLADFLDPEDTGRTLEGHPAPVRAIITANRG